MAGAPTSTSLRASAGCSASSSPAVSPPSENPTRSTGSPPSSAPRPAASGATMASASVPPGGGAESPKPGKSAARPCRPASSSRPMFRTQCVHEPLPPCNSTTGGSPARRSPHTCHTRSPCPPGVARRRPRARRSRWARGSRDGGSAKKDIVRGSVGSPRKAENATADCARLLCGIDPAPRRASRAEFWPMTVLAQPGRSSRCCRA